jgi:drug/metabolite transporter (DMT)-like permease
MPPPSKPATTAPTIALTILALVAFASNSVLCRVALRSGSIDAASFSTIRFIAGAGMLAGVTSWTGSAASDAGSWTSAGVLFLYAIPFSFAYTKLTAGTGALILFGAVQLTMMSAALRGGERPHLLEWCGLGLAVAGLVNLVLPGLAAPSLAGAGLMAVAGVAWGVYSLRGRGSASPLAETRSNFVRTVPLMLAASLVAIGQFHIEPQGALLAVLSGALASGLGYVVWYRALGGLTATRAAVVQLAVPILAAGGGVLVLAETISPRLVIAGALVLGGIALATSRERLIDRRRELT